MPAPLAVDREAVKVLVLAVGVREAARKMGIPVGTVAAWSARFGWLEGASTLQSAIAGASSPARDCIAEQLPASMRPVKPASGAISPADSMAEVNAENGARSRAAALRYSARNLEHLADLPTEEGVLLAPQAASLVKVAATAGDWSSTSRGSVRINILAADPFAQVQIEG